MKTSTLIILATFWLFAFNSGPIETNTKQAWYETGIERPIDEKITTSTKGKLYFEFHTSLQPKILNSDHFYTIQKFPKEYFTSYLVNTTDTTIVVRRQDGSVMMIQEAQDSAGTWTPIEHWQYSGCGNSYFDPLRIEPKHYVMIPIKKYQGDFNTDIRLKLMLGDQIFYSDSFQGSVDKNQFKSDSTKSQMFGFSYLENPRW